MVIEFDFEIYKNGDYDKVYLRNGKGQEEYQWSIGSRSYVIGKRTGTRIMGCCHILYG